jgi:hypothetical protein
VLALGAGVIDEMLSMPEECSRTQRDSTGLAEAFGGREGFSSSASHLDHIESGPRFAKPSGWICFNSFQLRRKENERTG